MKTIIQVAAATVLIGVAGSASALGVLSTNGTGAPGNCQAALPAYEGVIRKRPLAVANEGTTNAFVTCNLATEEVSLNVQGFWTRVSNIGTAPITVTCTSVVGDELSSNVSYINKTATIGAGQTATLSWSGSDVTGGLFASKSVAFQCNLPPMAALNRNSITVLLSLL